MAIQLNHLSFTEQKLFLRLLVGTIFNQAQSETSAYGRTSSVARFLYDISDHQKVSFIFKTLDKFPHLGALPALRWTKHNLDYIEPLFNPIEFEGINFELENIYFDLILKAALTMNVPSTQNNPLFFFRYALYIDQIVHFEMTQRILTQVERHKLTKQQSLSGLVFDTNTQAL